MPGTFDSSIEKIRCKQLFHNLPVAMLVEHALANKEGYLASTGSLVARTGKYTGRSPNDKFTVEEDLTKNDIAWGKINVPFSEEKFDALLNRILGYLEDKPVYVTDSFCGADTKYTLPIRFITQFAWHSLFVKQLFIRPDAEEMKAFAPGFTVVCAPNFHCDPERDGTNSEAAIILNFKRRVVLIAGSQYAGELKKSAFSVMNYLMPKANVFSMHCSANMGKAGDTALFFGLSGTGKTTLSADPLRRLIGDDQHGWSENGVFNFEGGCYAKMIKLSKEKEPQIWDAMKFGSVLENVLIDDKTRVPDYDSEIYTENTRGAYPLDYIPGAVIPSIGDHPRAVIFLTADAFGVLPPVAKLDPHMASYHFMSGYTSKLAGTERGIVEPQTTFSSCFGEPFLPLSPVKYAEMLAEKVRRHGSTVWLVNTGWAGGSYGVGKRMDITLTRAIITAILDGSLKDAEFKLHPIFNVWVPTSCNGVDAHLLDPRSMWADKEAYDKTAKDLASRFVKNFSKFKDATAEIIAAGPKA
ncbi:MAG TPA: phosphoenolpyruvate carboxykinase (ATP) [Bacillota bacterium]|nr:MAG: Phosphoenolpyruvate carboxykinase (ATP) [Firmicutes bacterium ADurb.Bin153]HNV34448.1 phosphoenolpyruvate carboxykinase (ATP) [Bacillota bacterium]